MKALLLLILITFLGASTLAKEPVDIDSLCDNPSSYLRKMYQKKFNHMMKIQERILEVESYQYRKGSSEPAYEERMINQLITDKEIAFNVAGNFYDRVASNEETIKDIVDACLEPRLDSEILRLVQ